MVASQYALESPFFFSVSGCKWREICSRLSVGMRSEVEECNGLVYKERNLQGLFLETPHGIRQ